MTNIYPVLTGILISAFISVLGAPVFGFLWEPVNPASTVFAVMVIVMRLPKVRTGKVNHFIAIIGGIFFFDFAMNKFYSASTGGISLLIGSICVLLLVSAFIPLTGTLKENGLKYVILSCSTMAATIYFFGIFYGGITPGVSDGPKLAAIISIIFIKLKKEPELDILWNALFIMGVIGNFIIPFLPFTGLVGETF